MQITYGTANTIRGLYPSEDVTYTIAETPTISTGLIAPLTEYGVTYSVLTGTQSDNNCIVNVSDSLVNPGYTLSLAPGSEAIATISSSGQLTRIADGTCTVLLNAKTGTRAITRIVHRLSTDVVQSVTSYAANTVAKQIADQMTAITNAYSGVPAATDLATLNARSVFQRHFATASAFPYGAINPNCFLLRADVAGWSPFTEAQLAVVANSTFWINNKYMHIGSGGVHGQYVSAADEAAGIEMALGADSRIRYYPAGNTGNEPIQTVLPANYASYLPYNMLKNARLPVFGRLTNTGNSSDRYWFQVLTTQNGFNELDPPNIASQLAFCPNETAMPGAFIRGGDSFSAIFTKINGTAVYITHICLGSGGTSTVMDRGTLETAMAAMAVKRGDATVYTATSVDLSGFTAVA
jgi:hypothetical protein